MHVMMSEISQMKMGLHLSLGESVNGIDSLGNIDVRRVKIKVELNCNIHFENSRAEFSCRHYMKVFVIIASSAYKYA